MATTLMDTLVNQTIYTTPDDAYTNYTNADYENITSQYVLDTVTHNSTTGADADMYHESMNNDYYEKIHAAASLRVRVKFFMMAFIIPLGLIFNTVAFIIFAQSKVLRRTTWSHFLIALTFADSTYLLGELLIWINTEDPYWGFIFGVRFTHANSFWCSTAFFLRNHGQFFSSWLTVAIIIERCLCVWMPFQVREMSTINRGRITITFLFMLSAFLNIYPYWVYKVTFKEEHDFYFCVPYSEETYNYWYTGTFRIGALYIPGIIVLITTILIIVKTRKMAQVRKSMSTRTRVAEQQQENIKNQMGRMLVLVAIAFIILRLPYSIISLVHIRMHGFQYSFAIVEDMALDVTYCIAAVNYSINLFLYCLSGNMFRKRLLACIRCHKLRRIISHRSRSTLSTNIDMASLKHKRNNKKNNEKPETNNI